MNVSGAKRENRYNRDNNRSIYRHLSKLPWVIPIALTARVLYGTVDPKEPEFRGDPKLAKIVDEVVQGELLDPEFVRPVLESRGFSVENIKEYTNVLLYRNELERISHILGDPVEKYMALISVESDGRHFDDDGNILRSKNGAYGVGQVKYSGFLEIWNFINGDNPRSKAQREAYPEIVRLLGKKLKGDKNALWRKVIKDPVLNMEVGAAYAHMTDEDGFSIGTYNTGPSGRFRDPFSAHQYGINIYSMQEKLEGMEGHLRRYAENEREIIKEAILRYRQSH